jgi:hypothetical protein
MHEENRTLRISLARLSDGLPPVKPRRAGCTWTNVVAGLMVVAALAYGTLCVLGLPYPFTPIGWSIFGACGLSGLTLGVLWSPVDKEA